MIGVFSEMRSKSSIDSLTPASRAMASRCSTPFVEPPLAITPVIALCSAFFVTMSRGRRFFFRSSITSFPASTQPASLAGSVAGMSFRPMGERPSIVRAMDIVLAVNWPPQAPAPGQALSSVSFSCAASILPAAQAPIAS